MILCVEIAKRRTAHRNLFITLALLFFSQDVRFPCRLACLACLFIPLCFVRALGSSFIMEFLELPWERHPVFDGSVTFCALPFELTSHQSVGSPGPDPVIGQGFTYFLEDIPPTALWQTRLVSQLDGFRFVHSKMLWHVRQAQLLLPDRSHYRNSTTGVPTASLFQNQLFTNIVICWLPELLLP